MKKFTMFFTVVLAILFISMPVFADSTHITANGQGDDHVLSPHDFQSNFCGDNIDSHDTKSMSDNNRSGILSGNTRSGILSGNDLEDSIVAAGDVDNSDHSVLKNADLSDSQNGLANQKGHKNQQGLVNQRGHNNQMGLLNIKGHGNQTGLVNIKGGLKNHSGQSHNKGIISQSQGNTGIIINAQAGNGGGFQGDEDADYDEPMTTNDGGKKYRKRHRKGKGGGGAGGNVNINAMIDNSTTTIEDRRELLPSKDVLPGPLNDYKGGYAKGSNFQTVQTLTQIKKNFSYEGALKTYGKQYGKGLCTTSGHSYNGRHEDNPSKDIDVWVDEYPKNVKVIGFLTVKADIKGKGKVDMFMVVQKAVLSACIMQGQGILITDQGADFVPVSSSWTIGFNTAGSLLNEQGNRAKGASGGGGPGYTKAKSSLITLPWVIVQVLEYTK